MTRAEHGESTERCEKATEGPWWWQDWTTYGDSDTGPNKQTLVAPRTDPQSHTEKYIVSFEDAPESESDSEFIGHARTDLPAALDWGKRCIEQIRLAAHFQIEDGVYRCKFCAYTGGHFPGCKAAALLREWEGGEKGERQ